MNSTKSRLFSVCFLLWAIGLYAPAQGVTDVPGQKRNMFATPSWAVKTNLLYDATTTFNLGMEFKVGRHYSFDLSANYNLWTFDNNKKLKHLLVQPELRYWLCEPFYAHFFGLHALYSHYNIGGMRLPLGILPRLDETRYQGDLYGVGLSYGYQWLLASRWSMEFSLGVGYLHLRYKAYKCASCGAYKHTRSRDYLAPTKLGISIIYNIK
ncbi:MAG: DUF3575 domain-containing protein [Mediterranea sp.]|jgi:hypothetical protein|nr:DUF3575 domain-containing protein [Mediterranea sp.]